MEWISVENLRPVNKQDILCYGFVADTPNYYKKEPAIFKCRYYEHNGVFRSRNIGCIITSHWMPLPEPPKK